MKSGIGVSLTVSSIIHLMFLLPVIFFYGYGRNDSGVEKASMFVEVVPMPLQAESAGKHTVSVPKQKAGRKTSSLEKKEAAGEPQKTSAVESFEGMKEKVSDEVAETSYKEISTLTGAPDLQADFKDIQSDNMQIHPSHGTADIDSSGSGERADAFTDHETRYGTDFSGDKTAGQTSPVPPLVIKPEYPRISRERGEEGNVILQVEMSSGGADIKVIKSSGYPRLDKAAMDAVEKGFAIFIKDSGVVAYNKTISVNFRIEGQE